MTPKNTICLWFNKDAEEAARFYAETFPAWWRRSPLRLLAGFPSLNQGG